MNELENLINMPQKLSNDDIIIKGAKPKNRKN